MNKADNRIHVTLTEHERVKKERDKLREAFLKYACHINGPSGMCESLKHSDYACTCGLEAALKDTE